MRFVGISGKKLDWVAHSCVDVQKWAIFNLNSFCKVRDSFRVYFELAFYKFYIQINWIVYRIKHCWNVFQIKMYMISYFKLFSCIIEKPNINRIILCIHSLVSSKIWITFRFAFEIKCNQAELFYVGVRLYVNLLWIIIIKSFLLVAHSPYIYTHKSSSFLMHKWIRICAQMSSLVVIYGCIFFSRMWL